MISPQRKKEIAEQLDKIYEAAMMEGELQIALDAMTEKRQTFESESTISRNSDA